MKCPRCGSVNPDSSQSCDCGYVFNLPPEAQKYLDEAYELEELGAFMKALQKCNAAIARAPDCADAYNLRGIILDDLGRVKEAVREYEKALELDPDLIEAQENLMDAKTNLSKPQQSSTEVESKAKKKLLSFLSVFGEIQLGWFLVVGAIGCIVGAGYGGYASGGGIGGAIFYCVFITIVACIIIPVAKPHGFALILAVVAAISFVAGDAATGFSTHLFRIGKYGFIGTLVGTFIGFAIGFIYEAIKLSAKEQNK
jgi:tetratricopeptide (TPR) repeat protein